MFNEEINMKKIKFIPFTFSPNTKNGNGKFCSKLLQFTEVLWINAAFDSVVRTFRFSLWKHTFG